MNNYKHRKKIVITDTVALQLHKIIQICINNNVKMLNLVYDEKSSRLTLEETANEISNFRYGFRDKLIIRAQNIPYCLFKQPEGVVYFRGRVDNFIKLSQCKECKYNSRCKGILKKYANVSDFSKIKSILDLPRETMIEIEPRCNLDCDFCFNKNSFAEKGRDIENKLSTPLIKRIINNTAKAGIPMVRFTGGEPLLRKDIWELAQYAKNKNLELRLNTNGILIKNFNIAKIIASYFDNVLLPIQYDDVLVNNNVAKAKIRAIKFLKRAGIKVLRAGTVATPEVIKNLTKVHKFIDLLSIDKWETYRVIATPNNKRSFTKKNVADLVEGLLKIRKQTGKTHYIINAIPFCSYDPIKIQTVALGADAVDGHERFAVDPRGFAKPIYYMRENIGDPVDVLACWNHSFMKKMRNLKFVPNECRKCVYLERCRGGCRFSSFVVNGNYKSPDPLMNKKNIIYK